MQYRRIRKGASAGVGSAILLGLGLGLAGGFLLGEFLAGAGPKGVGRAVARWRNGNRQRPYPASLTEELYEALEKLIGPEARSLDLVPVGRSALELHGWVTSRVSRARAIRATRELLDSSIMLVDRLLVWGEDDQPIPEKSLREEPEPA